MHGLIKKLLIFVGVMAAVGVCAVWGRKAYRGAAEHHLLLEASAYLKTNDFSHAELCLRRALQINPVSIQTTRLVADMLDTAGMPTALAWRIRTAQLEPGNATNRLTWAETALRIGDLKSAQEALTGITGAGTNSAAFLKLSGALAWAGHKNKEAEEYYKAALRSEPTNNAIALNLATIRLTSTNREIAQEARGVLEQLSNDHALSRNALEDLRNEAIMRKSLPDALKFSRQLAQDPQARFADKIEYLRLLKVATNADFTAQLGLLKGEATNSSAKAFALGKWLVMSEGPTNTLQWLESLPAGTLTNQPVPLLVTDCLIALKDWDGLLALTDSQNWSEADFYRLAVQALAHRSKGASYSSDSAWRRAFGQSTHRLDRLSRLTQVTANWGWKAENTEVLRQITSEFPKEKWAADNLIAELYAAGDTTRLLEFVSKVYAENPNDERIKNNLANLYLLRKSDLDKACRMAREAYNSSPKDPFFVSTLAYSLLVQNKPEEALKVLDDLKPQFLQIPSVAAYYGVVQAKSGRKDLAKEPLRRAETGQLLPEERELVRLASLGL